MSEPSPRQLVDELLAGMPSPEDERLPRNLLVANKALAEAVVYTLDKIQEGTLRITLKRFYESKMRAQFRGPRSFDTVKVYVKEFLKRDFLTGKPLTDD